LRHITRRLSYRRGIGRAIAERLARSGNAVIGFARKPPDDKFPDTFYPVDLSDRAAPAQVLERAVERHDIDRIVNNVGLNRVQSIEDVSFDKFEEVIDILRVAIQCTQAVLPGMKRKRFGRIVNISSRACPRPRRPEQLCGRQGGPHWDRSHLGARARGVRHHGERGCARAGRNRDVIQNAPPGFVEKFLAQIPMRRFGETDEIAAAVEFFLSKDGSCVTGQVLHVCGGMTVGHVPV
jgi:3-oxoacyl-[acyl-carrier protein] reductase